MDLTTIPVDYILKAAKTVKRLAYLIAAIGAIVSFGTQVNLLESWKISHTFAMGIAATVDILAICAAIAIQIPGLPDRDRLYVGLIMTFGLSVSITANVIAGLRESVGAAAGHAWPVVAYMLAEFIASRLRNFVARVMAAKEAKQKNETPVIDTTPIQATVIQGTPVQTTPAVKTGTAKAQILALAAMTPPLAIDAIAAKVGTKPSWVKHVIKTAA